MPEAGKRSADIATMALEAIPSPGRDLMVATCAT